MFLLVLAIALAVVQPGLQNPWLLKPENFMFGSKYASPCLASRIYNYCIIIVNPCVIDMQLLKEVWISDIFLTARK